MRLSEPSSADATSDCKDPDNRAAKREFEADLYQKLPVGSECEADGRVLIGGADVTEASTRTARFGRQPSRFARR